MNNQAKAQEDVRTSSYVCDRLLQIQASPFCVSIGLRKLGYILVTSSSTIYMYDFFKLCSLSLCSGAQLNKFVSRFWFSQLSF